MTDEELIEQIARTVGQKIEGAAEDMDSPWYGAPLWAAYIEEARAILPFIHADREAVRAEQAAELAKFKALAETLAGALEQIEEGTYPRPLGKPWRMDASSSKHDRCIHDAWMYEACEACIDAFASEALREYKEARDAS